MADPGPRLSLAERVPQLGTSAIIAAHRGDITSALDSLAEVDIIVPEIGTRDLLAGYRAVAVATIAAEQGHEEEAASALAAGLGDRELGPSQAGRAVLWFPAVAYLIDERCRRWLDTWPPGPQRVHTLAPARALLALRAGTPTDIELPPSAEALLTRLPVRQAIELLVRLDAAGRRVEPLMQAMCELAPAPARDALYRLEHQHPSLRKPAAALRATVPIPPPVGLRIDVLGPMRLWRGGVQVDDRDWQRERVRQMVAVLIGHRQIRRQRLGAMLWPEFDEDGVSANLRMTLSYVQGIFEPHRAKGDAPWYLHQAAGVLTLRDDDTITVDAWEVERLLDQADDASAAGVPSQQLNHLLAALALWRGDYLDDVAGQDWAESLRRRLSERLVNAAVRAAELLVGAGRADEAIRAAERATAADPWAEDAYRALAGAQHAQGNRVGAQRTLERAGSALAELGLDLSRATIEMAERLARSG